MNDFMYFTPTKVFFGEGYENKVGEIIKSYGYKKILFHYGKSSIKKNGLYDKVIKSLNDNNIEFIELPGVEANPKISLVRKGVEICKKENIDMVLAVGGGSVIDSSKSICDSALRNIDPWEYQIKNEKPDLNKRLPLGVILTIAAAGSEMSDSCVITNDKTHEKRGCSSEAHRPLFAIENPELTFSVDKFQTGCGIVDIMMHTMERYYSLNDNTILTDNLCLALCKSVVEAGKIVIKDPSNYNARAELMWASSLSHNGLMSGGKEYYMPVHQIEHEVSGMFDRVAHGAGLSVLFPAWAKYVYKSDVLRFKRFALEVMNVSNSGTDEDIAYRGILALEEFYHQIGMPIRFSELKIYEDSFESIAYNFTYKGKREIPDRIKIGYKEALEILKLAK